MVETLGKRGDKIMKKNIIKIGIVLLLLIIAFVYFTNPKTVRQESKMTVESFQDDMLGTWSTLGGKYELEFYYDDNNEYMVAYYERSGLEKQRIFNYPFRNITKINDGKYAYSLDLNALMENMGYEISLTKDGNRMVSSIAEDKVMFKLLF